MYKWCLIGVIATSILMVISAVGGAFASFGNSSIPEQAWQRIAVVSVCLLGLSLLGCFATGWSKRKS